MEVQKCTVEGEKDILKEQSDAEEEQNRVAEGSIGKTETPCPERLNGAFIFSNSIVFFM